VVLGASPDSATSHKKFKAKYELPYVLLVDEDHSIAEAYGVWVDKSSFGVKRKGIARTTFVIDRTGRIAKVFEKVKAENHATEVAEAVASLKS
jgi:thioredoxin-dependent peroxiredoxin